MRPNLSSLSTRISLAFVGAMLLAGCATSAYEPIGKEAYRSLFASVITK